VRVGKETKVKCKSLKVKAGLIDDGKVNVRVGEGNMKENLQKLVTEVRKYDIEINVYDTRSLNVINSASSCIRLLGSLRAFTFLEYNCILG
jgi:hypothetical protein